MDLGTANTLLYTRKHGIFINEPSVVAVDAASRKVLAVGAAAKEYLGRTPRSICAIRPMKDGVIADFDITREMIAHFVGKCISGLRLVKPSMVICIPTGITQVEKKAVIDAALLSGARTVSLVEEPMAAAIGAGMPVQEPLGSLVLDIGGGTSEVALISMAGVAVSQSVRVAGDAMNLAVQHYLREVFRLEVGENTAENVKKILGAALPPEGAQEPADRADSDEHSEEFDYSTFYRQFQETGAPQVDPLRQTYQAAFGKEEVMDGIPCKDWADFIGPASPAYLSAYCRMQLSHTKTSMSFSAMLFGPFYFFYRKAWKPAFAFLAAELVLALPTFIDLLQITDSSLAPGLSTSTLLTLSRVCSVLSFLLMIVRGLYGKWLYRQSAAEKIRRIRAEFPDAAQRKAVLCAQGGTSWAAVLGCLVLLMVIGSAFTLLLGPNVDALIHLVYG